jgi:glucosamine--fructose-6-phosphate aminotransferase (isomerizing)
MDKAKASHTILKLEEMCALVGIIGYIGREKAKPILLRGLKSLDCGGYDSIGIATISDSLKIRKGVGKMEIAVKDVDLADLEGNIGISAKPTRTHIPIAKNELQ